MLNLTKDERLVLLSFAFIFLIGVLLHFLLNSNSRLERLMNVMENDQLYNPIDVNKATPEQLAKIPYVGPVAARKIIDYRNQNGPLAEIGQLKSIPGIGNARYLKIVQFLNVRTPRR